MNKILRRTGTIACFPLFLLIALLYGVSFAASPTRTLAPSEHEICTLCFDALNNFLNKEQEASLRQQSSSTFPVDFAKALPEETRNKGAEVYSFFDKLDNNHPHIRPAVREWTGRFALENIRARESLGRSPEQAFLEEGVVFREKIQALLLLLGGSSSFMLHGRTEDKTPSLHRQASLVIQSATGPGLISVPSGPEKDVQVSPEGHFWAANVEGILVVYEASSGRELWRKPERLTGILRFVNGHLLVSTLGQGPMHPSTIDILDIRDGRLLHQSLISGRPQPSLQVFGEKDTLLAIESLLDEASYFAIVDTSNAALVEQISWDEYFYAALGSDSASLEKWMQKSDASSIPALMKKFMEERKSKAIRDFQDARETLVKKYALQRSATESTIGQASLGESVNDRVSAFAFAPSDTAFVATQNGMNRFVDFIGGRVREAMQTPGDFVVSARYSADGAFLAVATAKGRIWVMRGDGAPPQSMETELHGIRQVAVDAKGERVWVLHDAALSAPKKSPAALSLVSVTNGTVTLSPLALAPEATLDIDPDSDSAVILVLDERAGTKDTKPKNMLWKEGDALAIFLPRPVQYGVPLNCSRELLGWSAKDKVAIFQPTAVFQPGMGIDLTVPFVQSAVDGRARTFLRVPRTYNQAVAFSWSPFFSRAFFHPKGKVAALTEGANQASSSFSLYSLTTGSELLRMADATKHPVGITDGAFLHKSSRLVTLGNDGALRLWDYSQGTELINLVSWVFLTNGNYLVMDEYGRFDTPDLEDMDGVHWIVASQPGRTFPLDCFMRDYYQPRLAEYILAGRKLPPVEEIGERNLFQHAVTITEITPDPKTPERVAVSVEISGRDGEKIHPAQDLKLFRDGRMVARHRGDNGQDGVLALSGGILRHTFTNIALPAEQEKVNFTAYAFNADRVRSERGMREYSYPVLQAQSRLFLVAMGVNEFDNPAWNLRYAANDAKAFADILPRHLPALGGAAVALLASGGEAKPDRGSLRSLLLRLSGVSESEEPIPYRARSGPNDVVILTVSSHGLTAGDTFYILPADIPGKDRAVTPELLSNAISAEDLYAWLADLDAREIILILDTCESSAALGGERFRPGPMGDRGLGQLAYDKAIRVLSATNENNVAMEYAQLQHGLLSYALLREGLERSGAAKHGADPTLRDWLALWSGPNYRNVATHPRR